MVKIYTIRQASKMLGMSVRTVREWVWNGKLKAFKYTGSNMWRIPESEIKKMMTGTETDNADKG